jgi:hypothetical protein
MGWINTIRDLLYEDGMPELVEQPAAEIIVNNNVEGGSGKKSPGLLSSVRDIAFVVGIYSYFSGWVYVYAYFQFFGLSVGQSGIEIYSYLIYSYNVLEYVLSERGFVFWVSITVIAGMTLIRMIMRQKPRKKVSRFVLVAVLVLLFPFLLYYAQKAGSATAQFNAYNAQSLLPSIELHFKKESFATSLRGDSLEFARLLSINDKGGLKLISSTDAEVYVLSFKPDTSYLPVIFRIKKENIVYAKTYFHPKLNP